MAIKISRNRVDMNGVQMRWSKGSDIASASALAIPVDGNYFDVTGTTTITSINTTGGIGTIIKLHFDSALIFTHHATNLILPSGANITTAAGDEVEVIEYAGGQYRCTGYTKATGEAVIVGGSATEDWTDNGTGTTLDLDGNGNGAIKHIMSGNTTVTSSNLTSGKLSIFVIRLLQDGVGSHTITLPTGTVWPYAQTPVWPTAADSMCKFVLETWDAGTSWEASWIGAEYA
ncbi:hypothetical protein ACFL6I_25225 [candidate division KSB1 bacterium]